MLPLSRHRNTGSISRELDFLDLIGEKNDNNSCTEQHDMEINFNVATSVTIENDFILHNDQSARTMYRVSSMAFVNKNIELTFHGELHFIMIGHWTY